MKSSLEKFGRKLTMNKNDSKEKRDHQPPAHLDELVQASKDMQDIRNCYDGLIAAAAAMTNCMFEFSESLHEMGTCLLEKTTSDVDGESGKMLSNLGNIQLELQKIADSYRSYVIMTLTNPSESLLSELRKVEEMKLQCDEKRGVYEYIMSQHKEKGKLRSKSSVSQKLQEAQDEYNEVARLCVFRVKSLKEGQCRSLLTQATRHHAAQLNFFRKGLKVVESVDPFIRIMAEKHRIDYKLTGFDDGQNKQGVDNMESSGRQSVVSSYSAPLYPEKVDFSDKPQRKFHSYVLPSPVDTKSPDSRTPKSVSQRNPFTNQKRETDVNGIANSTIQLHSPSGFDSKLGKRQAYSGPLTPTKAFSGKIGSASRPISRSVSPPPLSSPKISELHELPRPPPPLSSSKPAGGVTGNSRSPPTKTPVVSPLPPPPLVVPRSFSVHSGNRNLMESPRITGQVSSPPLTPILLSNIKSTGM